MRVVFRRRLDGPSSGSGQESRIHDGGASLCTGGKSTEGSSREPVAGSRDEGECEADLGVVS